MMYLWLMSALLGVATAGQIDPLMYLHKFGYVSGGRSGAKSVRSGLIEFQKMARIPQTGMFDAATVKMMQHKRCGNKDKHGLRVKRSQSRWNKNALTYSFDNYSHELGKGATRRIISAAFKMWSDVTPLTFTEVRGRADIVIRFQAGQHGCNYPFDGPGGTLAHAFYPENGDAHFDEAEEFTENTDQGTNLMWVAAHEFGHSLGLKHTNDYDALMYPMYKGYVADMVLPRTDRLNIQAIYGEFGEVCADNPKHDANGDCKAWKEASYCRNHYDSMRAHCKKTCGFC